MTTAFFRFKKLVKSFIKSILPYWLYSFILTFYRGIVFNLPSLVKKAYGRVVFNKKTTITIKDGGFKIYVDPTNGHTDIMLYINNSRDKEVTDVMNTYLHDGSIFIDVGANIGYETLWGAKLVGNNGRVISFEPVPKIANQLEESILLNNFKNINLIRKAASDTIQKIKIFLNNKDAGSSSIINNQNGSNGIEIETTTLDKELKNINKIDLIKIDVEGYEPQVISGAHNVLNKFTPPVVFEFQPYLYNSKYDNILSILINRYGYNLYQIETTNKVLIPEENIQDFTNLLVEEKSLVNILAIKK